MIVLKQFGTPGVKYLTNVRNLSLSSHIVSEAGCCRSWCQARMLAKANPRGQFLSLLSLVANIIEAFLLPSIRWGCPVANHEQGFGPQHSTTWFLMLAISTHISQGLNQNRPSHRTVVALFGPSKAFNAGRWQRYPLTEFEMLDSQLYVICEYVCNAKKKYSDLPECRPEKCDRRRMFFPYVSIIILYFVTHIIICRLKSEQYIWTLLYEFFLN